MVDARTKSNVKELFSREGYKCLEEGSVMIFLQEGLPTIKVDYNHGA